MKRFRNLSVSTLLTSLILGLGGSVIFTATTAAQGVAPALPPGIIKGASVEGITEYQLSNGMRFLLFPDSSKQTATVNITYLVGSRHEGYGETGMAHLLEHMQFKGTPRHPNIPAELTSHGSRPNASTWYDRTNFFESFASTEENLDWALDLEADRMVNSFIARKDLDTEMTVVRNEFEIGENDPQTILTQRILSTAYLWHNYGKDTIGSRVDIERVPIERLQAFYHIWYRPDNAVLVVAGKFDETRTIGKIASTFGAIHRPTRSLDTTYTEEPAQDGERSVTLRRIGDVQVVAAAYHIPSGSHADYPAVDLLSFILTDTPSGRLYKALVERKMASSVFGYSMALHDAGVTVLGAQVRADGSIDDARGALLRVIDEATSKPFEIAEVQRAKDNRLNDWETTMRSSERAALELSEWMGAGDWRLLFIYRDRLKTVTPADVARVAKAYLRVENRTVGVFLPTKQATRAEIPLNPDVAAMVKDYKGGEALSSGEAFDSSPSAIEARTFRLTLPPGIKLVMVPKKTRGSTVQASITLHLGDESSLKGTATAADLAGGMLLRGTSKHSRQEIQDQIDHIKAQLRVNGSALGAFASIETTRENLAPALQLAVEALREPSFPESEFERLRQEYLAAADGDKSDPRSKAMTALQKHLNPWPVDDPRYVTSPQEGIERLRAATLDEVKRFHADFYGASAAEVAIVGDFDPKEVEALLRSLLGDWKSAKPFARLATTWMDRPVISERIEAPDKESAVFMAGLRIPMRDDAPQYPALVLGNFMTGGGFLKSRLADRIRQREGLSYGVSSFFSASPFDQDAMFGSYAIYAPQNADKFIAAFQDELAKIIDKGFTADEIAEAKNGWLQGRQVSRSTDRELVRTLAAREYLGRTLAWDETFEKNVAALNGDQILAAVKKFIDPKKISTVQAGDFAGAKK